MENLSDDDLLHIFGYFNPEDLFNTSQVCKRWHSVITSSSKLARRLFLVFYGEDSESLLTTTDRSGKFPFRYYCIQYFDSTNRENWNICKEALKEQKSSIEKLKFQGCDDDFLVEAISTGVNANLTHLSIDRFTSSNIKVKFDFPNLKFLKLTDAHAFTVYINSHKIEVLILIKDFQNRFSFASDELKDFFETCKDLKELKLSNLEKIYPAMLSFKLEKFEVGLIKFRQAVLVDFLESQRETLKVLKIWSLTAETVAFAFNELNLETFQVGCVIFDLWPKYTLNINQSIKELRFTPYGLKPLSGRFDKLFDNLKAVETLELHPKADEYLKVFDAISCSMPNLRHLMINQIKDGFCHLSIFFAHFSKIKNVQMQHIEEFSFTDSSFELKQLLMLRTKTTRINWFNDLLTCFPNLKRLNLIGTTNVQTFDKLTKTKNIKQSFSSLRKLFEVTYEKKKFKITIDRKNLPQAAKDVKTFARIEMEDAEKFERDSTFIRVEYFY